MLKKIDLGMVAHACSSARETEAGGHALRPGGKSLNKENKNNNHFLVQFVVENVTFENIVPLR